MIKSRKKIMGFTLVELIIVIAFLSVIISIAGSMMVFSFRSNDIVEKEYVIQANMRLASEVINQQVRHSTAIFLLNSAQFGGSGDLKAGWNYFTLSDDKSEIVQYVWDETTSSHNANKLTTAQPGILYGLNFTGDQSKYKMVNYQLDGSILDSGNVKVSIKSDLSALNTVVVDDSSTLSQPAIALAYRLEDIPNAEKIKVAVTMVLDKSGSMGYEMGNGNSDIRIAVMKAKASELIDTFADLDNVYVSLVPFSTNANNPGDFLLAKDNRDALKASINGLIANGGTNAGDGLRRSYYNHVTFNSTEPDRVLNYTILLMDGNPTYYPVSGGSYFFGTGNIGSSNLGGNGSSTITDSMSYIEAFGNTLIKNTTVTQTVFMKTFVIGFTAIPTEVTRAGDIATYHNHSVDDRIKGFYYAATNSQELANVFNAITEYILLDTWHIYGPTE